MIKDFALALAEVAEMVVDQSSPEQRVAWINDIVTKGFKETFAEGKEKEFLKQIAPDVDTKKNNHRNCDRKPRRL
jgi:hypothetical protein